MSKKIRNFSKNFRKNLAGGQSPPRPLPLNDRSPHLIEAAKRGRLDQMIFCSAPLTTRAPPGRPAGHPAEPPAGRPLTTRAPPTTVFLNLKNPKNFNLLKNSIYSDHPLQPWPPKKNIHWKHKSTYNHASARLLLSSSNAQHSELHK